MKYIIERMIFHAKWLSLLLKSLVVFYIEKCILFPQQDVPDNDPSVFTVANFSFNFS